MNAIMLVFIFGNNAIITIFDAIVNIILIIFTMLYIRENEIFHKILTLMIRIIKVIVIIMIMIMVIIVKLKVVVLVIKISSSNSR